MAGRLAFAAAAVAAAVGVTGASGAPRVVGPDPAAMTLQAADFPGAHAKGRRLSASGSALAAYEREITFAKPYGSSRYVDVVSIAFLVGDPSEGADLYRLLGHRFSSKAYRLKFIRTYLPLAGIGKVRMIKPRALGVKDSSMEIGFLIRLGSHTLTLSMSMLRVDRVVVMNVAAGTVARIVAADARTFATLTAAHDAAALVPIELSPPAISGTAAQGQTLSASTGGWEDLPTAYAYQWERCDGSGANCAAVAGATSATYAVSSADAGSTLRVAVTATNRFGSVSATSSQTAVVT